MLATNLRPVATTEMPDWEIALWFKLAYTLFVVVLLPVYIREYGFSNLLYFCDVALFITLIGLWLESPLMMSTAAVGVLLPQAIWIGDFVAGMCGVKLTGMAEYMFRPSVSLPLRAMSLFHVWLPFVVLWQVYHLGYDPRAYWTWIALSWALQLTCYFLTPPPPAPRDRPNLAVNVNYVFGPSSNGPQRWMHGWAWLGLVMILSPLIAWPTHVLLRNFMPQLH